MLSDQAFGVVHSSTEFIYQLLGITSTETNNLWMVGWVCYDISFLGDIKKCDTFNSAI
jgi:hypothetical protein